MARVLVTGGTGTLGRAVVPRLQAGGHDVRVLSRSPAPELLPGVAGCRGDVRTGAGLAAAVADADVVVHAATNPRRHLNETEVEGTRHVAAAAAHVGAHLIYVSIVGVDRHRMPYYRAKRAAEQTVIESGASWTVLRATQFHDLIHQLLGSGWFFRTSNLRFQPVHVDDVAHRLVEIVAGPPLEWAPDFGGPEILAIDELAATHREATGRRTRLVPVPRIGLLADFDAGVHLAPAHRSGTRTWREWLARR